MEITVNAKVNLTLEVTDLRTDGYHNLHSIMQTVSLADYMTIEKADEIDVEGQGYGFSAAKSLVLRAAHLFQERSGYAAGAHIVIDKKIPFQSGMGADSAGAAAVLKHLNILWRTDWSLEELSLLAGELGSDVPFFIWGGTALLSGRGQKILTLPRMPRAYFCALLDENLRENKTGQAYAAIDLAGFDQHGYTEALRLKLETGQKISESDYYNSFDRVAPVLYTQYEDRVKMMLTAGASKVMLAGSGPTLIAPCAGDEDKALKICLHLLAQGQRAVTFYTL